MIDFRRDRIPAARAGSDDPRVAILYENGAWLGAMYDELERRGIPYEPFRMDDAAVLLDRPLAFPLVINRVSPSSYLRGHGPAIPFARAVLDLLEAHGHRVVNGARSFALETSKTAQHLLLEGLGVSVPLTLLFNGTRRLAAEAEGFPYPAIIKPNCGGSGAFVREVPDHLALMGLLEDDPALFGSEHLLLLQEKIVPADGTVTRLEFVDGHFVYAMRVRATNTFNLCPADGCERHAADPDRPEPARVEFIPYPGVPDDMVAQAREIVRAAGLDVGGIELMETADGRRWYIDINATSVYREDICAAVGVDAVGMLGDFIAAEYRKELAKRGHHGPRAAGLRDEPKKVT